MQSDKVRGDYLTSIPFGIKIFTSRTFLDSQVYHVIGNPFGCIHWSQKKGSHRDWHLNKHYRQPVAQLPFS